MDMTKFEHVDDPGFVAIAGELRRCIKELSAAESSRSPDSASFSTLSLGPGGVNNSQGENPEPGMAGHFYRGMPTAGYVDSVLSSATYDY
jgi:hypothetical protein